ncbi:hypothetical protein GJV07_23570 [Enterobacteriaceae bacterium RIT711]|nr:hypothetical protein [Enterobacteriaceae bacterium RIT711]
MISEQQRQLMRMRLNVAKSTFKFFDEHKIRSPNSMTHHFFKMRHPYQHRENKITIDNYRENTACNGSILTSFHNAALTKLGNCQEKACICYSSLCGNPILLNNSEKSYVSLCHGVEYDHVLVIISDNPITRYSMINTLGVTALIVDAWTNDLYFPNSPLFEFKNIPNPVQSRVRFRLIASPVSQFENFPELPESQLVNVSLFSKKTHL